MQRGLYGSGSSSEGFGWQLHGGGYADGSMNPTVHAPEHRALGHSPGSGLLPGQAEARRAQDSKDAPAQAEEISGPAPRASRPLQTETSVVTAGADSRAPEMAPPLRLFLLRPHRINNPH